MRPLLKEITALNFYHINIIQTMKPMYKINMKQIREYSFFNFVRQITNIQQGSIRKNLPVKSPASQ